jgi:hypothetical protein
MRPSHRLLGTTVTRQKRRQNGTASGGGGSAAGDGGSPRVGQKIWRLQLMSQTSCTFLFLIVATLVVFNACAAPPDVDYEPVRLEVHSDQKELLCSGKFKADDVLIIKSNISMADLIAGFQDLKSDFQDLKSKNRAMEQVLQQLQKNQASIIADSQRQVAGIRSMSVDDPAVEIRDGKFPLRPGWLSFSSVFDEEHLIGLLDFDSTMQGEEHPGGHYLECRPHSGKLFLMGTDRNTNDANADQAIRSYLAFSHPALNGVPLDLVRFGSANSRQGVDIAGSAVRMDMLDNGDRRLRCESENYGKSIYTKTPW